mmetsp:Transcript_5699/g.19730  ORF Transcript_5699/g.19730 Transcript_5699/m.19730 type:complete len:271 (-) Transcript_5699:636-1448(-)
MPLPNREHGAMRLDGLGQVVGGRVRPVLAPVAVVDEVGARDAEANLLPGNLAQLPRDRLVRQHLLKLPLGVHLPGGEVLVVPGARGGEGLQPGPEGLQGVEDRPDQNAVLHVDLNVPRADPNVLLHRVVGLAKHFRKVVQAEQHAPLQQVLVVRVHAGADAGVQVGPGARRNVDVSANQAGDGRPALPDRPHGGLGEVLEERVAGQPRQDAELDREGPRPGRARQLRLVGRDAVPQVDRPKGQPRPGPRLPAPRILEGGRQALAEVQGDP